MTREKLPFIQWRPQPDGTLRPRFMPSKREVDLGFPSCDLRHGERGGWYSYDEARAWIYGPDGRSGVYGEILAARKTGKRRRATAMVPRDRTVEHLLRDWMRAIEGERGPDRLKASSIDSYRKDVEMLMWRPQTREDAKARRNAEAAGVPHAPRVREPFVQLPVADVGPPELKALFNYLRSARGHHAALHGIAAFSAAWRFGQTSTYWRLGPNPRHEIELKRPEGRIRFITAAAIAALVAAADALGRPSIGHSILLGLFTGQRQNDRLALRDEGLIDGRRRFRQSKTGRVVEIKEAPRLAARMAEARAQAARIKLRLGLEEVPANIVFDEATGAEYSANAYSHRYDDARLIATHGWRADETLAQAMRRAEDSHRARQTTNPGYFDWRVTPCADVALDDLGKWSPARDQDLRDTCVTLLYRAGCTLLQICDITGHSYQAVKTIRDHYLARDTASADVAIDKLVTYMDATGMAI